MANRTRTQLTPVTILCVVLVNTALCSARAFRGANTWYSYLGAANETQTLAAAQYMAENLLAYGYDTFTLDEGWAENNGVQYLDAYGRLSWNPDMYPSGMPAVATALKGMGIKLGLWLVRGVPRIAVNNRLPIYGTSYTADQAVRFDRNCSWNSQTFGSNYPSSAAEAYYDSLATSIASWGVSMVKIDCLWPSKYEGTPQVYFNEDVEAMTAAFRRAGLTISLSPGISVSPLNGSYIASGDRADFYRVAEDVLDVYYGAPDNTFPTGVHQKLRKAVEFESLLGVNGTWPDFDMLMLGRTIHAYGPGQVPPTETHLTHAEQVTAVTLDAFTGVPMILGGFLPLDDSVNGSWTLQLLTNREILAVHNASSARKSFQPSGTPGSDFYGWTNQPTNSQVPAATRFVALFNGGNADAAVSARFAEDLGLPAGTTSVCMRDLWAGTWEEPVGGPIASQGGAFGVAVGVQLHGARAALVTPVGSTDCYNGLAQ